MANWQLSSAVILAKGGGTENPYGVDDENGKVTEGRIFSQRHSLNVSTRAYSYIPAGNKSTSVPRHSTAVPVDGSRLFPQYIERYS